MTANRKAAPVPVVMPNPIHRASSPAPMQSTSRGVDPGGMICHPADPETRRLAAAIAAPTASAAAATRPWPWKTIAARPRPASATPRPRPRRPSARTIIDTPSQATNAAAASTTNGSQQRRAPPGRRATAQGLRRRRRLRARARSGWSGIARARSPPGCPPKPSPRRCRREA